MASPYEVAIHLTVTGNAQSGLAAAGQQINKLNEGVEKLHKAFALLFVGGEMKRWGEEATGAVKKVLDMAGNFQQVQNQMAQMGMTQKEIGESVGRSWKLAADNIHVGVQEIAQMNRHAIEIFGGAEAAAKHMPLMAKLAEWQAKWGAGKTGLKQVDVAMSIRDIMKTTEGAAMLQEDPKLFDRFAENAFRMQVSTGGNVSSSQYLQAQRHARAAAFGWSDSFRFGVFPAMVQEYGPNAGVMSQQAFSKLVSGLEWKKTGIVQGIEMGLIDPKKVEYDKTGKPMRLMPGAVLHAGEFAEDPLHYTEKYVTPWLNKHTKNIGERTAALGRLMGRGTAASDLIAFDTQAFKYEKDRPLYEKAGLTIPPGWDQSVLAFTEKWKDLMIALGTPSLKDATSALDGITKAIINLTGVFLAHPDIPKNLMAVAAGFGAVMTVLGGAAFIAGIGSLLGGGAVIVGLTALTGALAGLAAANWPAIKSKFQEFLDSLRNTDWNAEITKALTPVFAAMKTFFSNLGSAIVDAFKGMWEDMKGALGGLFHHINFGGGGGGGGMGSSGALSAGERGQYADIIRKVSLQEGVDPNALLKIYGTEGRTAWFGDGGHSIGPFQLHDRYLGAQFHGDRSRSAHGVEDQARFVARYGKAHGGWSSDIWHGLRDQGVGSIPYRGHKGGETHVHNNIYLDGKMIAKSTSKHLVRAAQYPTSVGRQDGRGVFMSPAAEVFA
jgi:hypothetical protein